MHEGAVTHETTHAFGKKTVSSRVLGLPEAVLTIAHSNSIYGYIEPFKMNLALFTAY